MADAASLRLMVEAVRWSSLSATAAAVAAAATGGQQGGAPSAGGIGGGQQQGGHQLVQQPPTSISAPVSMHFDVDPDDIIMNGETVRLLALCLFCVLGFGCD